MSDESFDLESPSEMLEDAQSLVNLAAHELRQADPDLTRIHNSVNIFGRTFAKSRPFIVNFYNTFQTLADQLSHGEMEAAAAERKLRLASAELLEALRKIQPSLSQEDFQKKSEGDAAALLKINREASVRLRSGILRTGLHFEHAPIVCMAAFDKEKLRRANIAYADLSGYVCLTSQRVFGISVDFANNLLERSIEADKSGGSAIVKKLRRTRAPDSVGKIVSEALEAVYQETLDTYFARNRAQRYIAISHNAWANARWYWFMPEREYNSLRAATFAQGGLARWGFAFESRHATPPHSKG